MYILLFSVKTLEDNRELKDRMSNMALPVKEYVKIPLSDEECEYSPACIKHELVLSKHILIIPKG